ncbi:MAG TPA: hypothetical protein VNM87_12855, partial [Candidatus Udaeobacter sp.]|nr:hypothetical protein [Candidatus Udaeobacter sp.]
MSFDEPGSPPPDTLEPAHYVAFLEHWAAEFPTVPRSRPLPAEPEAEQDEHPLAAGPQAGAEPPGATPPPVPDWAPK